MKQLDSEDKGVQGGLPDLNLPSIIDLKNNVLSLEGVPDKAVMMLALRAIGLTTPRIAQLMSCTRQCVESYLNRYDPQNLCTITPETRRMITTQMLQTTAITSLMGITQEKLDDSSATDLARIATSCATTAEKMTMAKHITTALTASKVESMLDSLDVEYTEEASE
jgi:predicted transcriptional regulator